MWVGNWSECVVSLGAPDARVLAFIALGERFLLDVSLSLWLQVGGSCAVGGSHCGFHAKVQRRWLWANCFTIANVQYFVLRRRIPHSIKSLVWIDGIWSVMLILTTVGVVFFNIDISNVSF